MSQPAPQPKPQPPPKSPGGWRHWRWALAVVVILGLVALALALPAHFKAQTNDAYVEADVVTVAPKVPGYVVKLNVDDNARIRQGEELLQIDDREYRIAVANAQADLANAKAARSQVAALLARQSHLIASARASLSGDRSQATFAAQQVARYGPLASVGFGSIEHLQQAQADNGAKQSSVQKDTADIAATEAQVSVLQSQLQEADAEIARRTALLDQARLNLAYTHLPADVDGTVANRLVRLGNYVQPGQALLSEVPSRVYVVANYKETQVDHMRLGQPVWIHVDAFPDIRFRGHIDSFQRGTGSRFALLPPENATGNFVKIVQRLPVKILFDEPRDRLPLLAPGMSVETNVDLAANGRKSP